MSVCKSKMMVTTAFVFITVSLLSASCQNKPKVQHPIIHTSNSGNWYTSHRQMQFEESQNSIVEIYESSEQKYIREYKIDTIERPNPRMLLITLQAKEMNTNRFQRLFVFSSNKKNMREFKGSHIVHWSRNP